MHDLDLQRKRSSWGLSLFVLFEQFFDNQKSPIGSWGLSLFVLFEPYLFKYQHLKGSWGLSLFVLFEQFTACKI